MTTRSDSGFSVKLFYSYSHNDSHKQDMERSLAILRREGVLDDWSDSQLLPGQRMSEEIGNKMKQTDIFCFLVSQNFFDSNECVKEWDYAKTLLEEEKKFLVPIILKPCDWKNFDDMKKYLALPTDGRPICEFENQDEAWQQVSQGIRKIVQQIRQCYNPKQEFMDELNSTEFLSQHRDKITLKDVFVFPSLFMQKIYAGNNTDYERKVEDIHEILSTQHALIKGDEMSGKTTLLKHIFLELTNQGKAAMYIDLKDIESKKSKEHVFRKEFSNQFSGDFEYWRKQHNVTILLDNLTQSPHSVDHVLSAVGEFKNVIVSVSSDVHSAFFLDDARLAKFTGIRISPLSRAQQEQLIRQWNDLSPNRRISDDIVDQIERDVDSIILGNRIVPRFPFYVLSILQSREAFMPEDLNVTSYGYCYFIMIVAYLTRSGISKQDASIESCINFASYYAYHLYKETHSCSSQPVSEDLFEKISSNYKKKFVIKESIISRLQNFSYGIFRERNFRTPYMFYYFLGHYFANNFSEKNRNEIESMAQNSHITANRLVLIFCIHHSKDCEILDEILLQTMCTFDEMKPASLSSDETSVLEACISNVKSDILSNQSVRKEREKERYRRDLADEDRANESVTEESPVNAVYRILKNNEILGQILRNKHGTLPKEKLHEIIETISDGGLRLIKRFLWDENEINDFAQCVRAQNPDYDLEKIKKALQILVFLITVSMIERVIASINIPLLRELIRKIVESKDTPAYDLIDYFSQLDTLTIDGFSPDLRRYLEMLLKKHKSIFMQRVISLRTQIYMNTHELSVPMRQSLSSLLKIKYKPRRKDSNTSYN